MERRAGGKSLMAGKKQAPQKFEEPDETEGWEEAVVETDSKDAEADARLRDWRDVERYREMKELRRLVDDDYGLEEIFHLPLKPRSDVAIPPKSAAAKPVPKPAAAATRPDGKTPPKAAAKPAPKPKAPAKLKAKAKRR